MNKHEYLRKENYYQSNLVGTKARCDKHCEYCGRIIPKGQPHESHKFYDSGDWPTYPTHIMHPIYGDSLNKGQESCSQLFIKSLN